MSWGAHKWHFKIFWTEWKLKQHLKIGGIELRRKFIAVTEYVRKEESSQISYLKFHPK